MGLTSHMTSACPDFSVMPEHASPVCVFVCVGGAVISPFLGMASTLRKAGPGTGLWLGRKMGLT